MTNIGDVARHLGVSRSTVSYALSGKRPVSTEMKARIDAAIRELDYWPSAAGLSLATSRRNIIGLLAPLGENATPSVALQFVDGVARSSRTHGFDTLLVTGREAFEGVERLVRAGVVDGLVALDVGQGDAFLVVTESGRVLVDGGGTFDASYEFGRTRLLPRLGEPELWRLWRVFAASL